MNLVLHYSWLATGSANTVSKKISYFFEQTSHSCFFVWLFFLFTLGEAAVASSAGRNPRENPFFSIKGSSHILGVSVVRVKDGGELYSHNRSKLLSPASLTKLISSAAVLNYFGPHERFPTGFYYRGQRLANGVRGDLVIVGGGDPLFLSETLWQVAADLKNMGIRKFTGSIIIDNSLFSDAFRDELRLEGIDTSTHSYDAPISAFGVNFNTVAVKMSPGPKEGDMAIANLDPYPLANIEIVSEVKTSALTRRLHVRAKRTSLPYGRAKIRLLGSIPVGNQGVKKYLSTNDPMKTSGELVRSFLQAAGVQVVGPVVSGQLGKGDKLLFQVLSQPISELVKKSNEYSNNYISDMLVKVLGAKYSKDTGTPGRGSFDSGILAVKDFLERCVGIDSSYTLVNGSGLTTRNRLSPSQITQLLVYISKNWIFYPEFLVSLPVAAKNGTLDMRFRLEEVSSLKGQIRAKTGTMTNPISVSNLAGYFKHPRHGLIAFAVMQNGKKNKPQPQIAKLQRVQETGLLKMIRTL